MKNILLLGATGFLGSQVLEQLLRNNYAVTVLVRDSAKIIPKDHLMIKQGNVLNPIEVQSVLINMDTVIECLGSGKTSSVKQSTFTSEALKILINEMEKSSITRLICASNYGTKSSKSSWFFSKIIIPFFIPRLIAKVKDKDKIDIMLKNSTLDYTVACFPKITEKKENKALRISTTGKIRFSITVADSAKFLIRQIENQVFIKKFVSVSN